MKVSVIVAVKDGVETIERLLQSYAAQSHVDKELIVFDGLSTDGTVAILQKNSAYIDYWESSKDTGISQAWNRALDVARGDWLLFIGADDYFASPDALAKLLSHAAGNGADLIYGNVKFEGGDLVIGEKWNKWRFLYRMTVPHTAALHARRLFANRERFDESYRISMDYEFLLRFKNLKALHVNSVITVMGVEGVSSKHVLKSLDESFRAKVKNGRLPKLLAKLVFVVQRASLGLK